MKRQKLILHIDSPSLNIIFRSNICRICILTFRKNAPRLQCFRTCFDALPLLVKRVANRSDIQEFANINNNYTNNSNYDWAGPLVSKIFSFLVESLLIVQKYFQDSQLLVRNFLALIVGFFTTTIS